MKLLTTLLISVFALCSYAQSQNGSDVLALAVKSLPPCALKCTISEIASSTCELTDIDCIKANKKLLNKLSVCVKSSCSVKEALTAKRFLQELLGAPIRDKTRVGSLVSLIPGGVAVFAYILRVIARLPLLGGQWGSDDWVMTAAMVLIIPLTVCAELLNRRGLGTDMWRVPFENITSILEIFYYTELLYLTSIALTKISILLFYLRIFPNRSLRRAIYVTIVLCILYMIAFVTATALQCIPIRIAWEKWDGEHHGRCINLNADGWCSAAVNIILDLIVIVIPIRELSTLAMSRRRKFGVMLMFLGGGFVTIVSILRLKYLIQFAYTDNVTWDYLPIGYWSAVESHVGVMVACAPAIRQLQRSLRDRFFPKTQTSSSYYQNNTTETIGSGRKSGSKVSKSHVWLSKTDRSQLSTMGRSKVDKDDFVRLDEYEMGVGGGVKSGVMDDRFSSPDLSDRSLNRSLNSNQDVQPLAPVASPMGSPLGGIMVQSEYSVDRASTKSGLPHPGLPPVHGSEEKFTDRRRWL